MSTYEERAERRERRRHRKKIAKLAAVVLLVALGIAAAVIIAMVTRDRYEPLPENDALTVVTAKAQVFEEDEEDSKALGTVTFGEALTPMGSYRDWYRVDFDGKEAYVRAADVLQYDKTRKYVALTFDDGPKSGSSDKILKSLKDNGCRATFFVIGNNIDEKTGKLLRKGTKQGCEYGNHSKSHVNLTDLNEKKIKKQLAAVDRKVKEFTGHETTLVRVPYGDFNKKVLAALGRPNIMWSVDTRDWDDRNTKHLIKAVKKGADDGAIILMHEIYDSTAEAVDPICKNLKADGYEAVTVTELAAIKGVKLAAGESYESF